MRATNISWIPGWLLRISKNRSKYCIEVIRRSEMNFHSVAYRDTPGCTLSFSMNADDSEISYFRVQTNYPRSSKDPFFFPFFFFYHSSRMKNVRGDLNRNHDKNTESEEWKYSSNAILPFFPDKLRLLFFASYLYFGSAWIMKKIFCDDYERQRFAFFKFIRIHRTLSLALFRFLTSLSFFFLFILPHGREFKCARIVNTWDRVFVNGCAWTDSYGVL